jgi:predicted phage-related endonuclease
MTYNKSEICKRANQLMKEGYTKSEAFTQAWAEAKTPDTIAAKARQFKEIQRMIEELEAQANAVKESIIADMDGAEEVTADIFKIRYITVTSNRLDTSRFKSEHNDLYTTYLKESSAKRFTVVA